MKTFNKSGILLYEIDEDKEISRGGEGRVMEINKDKVAKIYLGKSSLEEKKFIELSALQSNLFVKPEELLFDQKGMIIGFTMIKIPSDHFPLISLFNKNFCIREDISLSVKQKIAEKLIEGINFAHSKNVIIGDLNPYNILVNEAGSVYFIDVDSYETTNFKHSGILLEDIRDFLYNGEVNIKSDYFALSILIFNSLTYVHPFKGVHKKYPKICDRMIHKESILKQSPDLIIPKCYEAFSDPFIIDQFKKIFNEGNRTLLKLSNSGSNVVQKVVTTSIKTNNSLMIHNIYTGNIIKSFASKDLLAIITENFELLLYDVSIKGITKLILSYSNFDKKSEIFVYGKTLYYISNNSLFLFKESSSVKIMDFPCKVKSQMYENIIVVITDKYLYKFNLNKKYGDIIPFDIVSIFGGKFTKRDGLFQNISGNTVLFYEKNSLNSSILPISIKNSIQSNNVGILEILENEVIIYKFFALKNLKCELFDCSYDIRSIDLLNESTLIIPEDDKLILIRVEDMQPIVEFSCPEISKDSIIHCTSAGIIVINQNSIILLNKK